MLNHTNFFLSPSLQLVVGWQKKHGACFFFPQGAEEVLSPVRRLSSEVNLTVSWRHEVFYPPGNKAKALFRDY